jgi:hypothetical protein
MLTFTPGNWNVPQPVTVTGVDDMVADGNVVYSIITAPAVSAGPYNGVDPADVTVTNNDDEVATFTVGPLMGVVHDGGGMATFTVVLDVQPSADVTVGISSDDVSKGTVAPPSLLFTPMNWNVPQMVTVTGGGTPGMFNVVTAPAVSTSGYNGVNPADVPVTNVVGP